MRRQRLRATELLAISETALKAVSLRSTVQN